MGCTIPRSQRLESPSGFGGSAISPSLILVEDYEYLDGEIKRSRNVETGIQTESDTEVTDGVQEGMTILAGQS